MPITSSSSKNNGGNSSGGNRRKPGSDGPMHVYAPEPVNINRHSYNVRRDTHPQTPPGTLYDPFELPDPYAGGMKISLPTIMRKGYELKKKSEASIPVSSPEDKEEKEADQVAEEVMTDLQAEKKKKKLSEETSPDQVMGKGTDGGTLDAETTAGVRNLQGKGSPLPDRTRVDMEQSFGADFSNVRVHTGAEAETLSRSMNARAFTYGSDIAFNKGEYSPDSQSGKRLLAHELTHTVQQGAVGRKVQREKESNKADKTGENENKKLLFGSIVLNKPWLYEASSPSSLGAFHYNYEAGTEKFVRGEWKRDAFSSGFLGIAPGILAMAITRMTTSKLIEIAINAGAMGTDFAFAYKGLQVEERFSANTIEKHNWLGRFRRNILTGEFVAIEFHGRGPTVRIPIAPILYQSRLVDAKGNVIFTTKPQPVKIFGMSLYVEYEDVVNHISIPEKNFGVFE